MDALLALSADACPGKVESCHTSFYGICEDCLV
jgi:hypothetical protein